ncbi:MAG TPA: ATP-binding cassette domain-containing protein [Thermodesulfobacteriota bacterium]|nr:ATP-binding cassette domain-containing protein [Thermodesulfobacteriota bacterium]
MNKPKIELNKVGKIKNGEVILRDINLKFISGEKHVLVGPSGSGKTTLLRLLNRMEDPSSGEIIYEGKNIKDIPVLELRRKVGMVFQIPVVFEGTAKDNLMIPYSLGEISANTDEKELMKALYLAGLQTDLFHRNASSLSVGEKQRLNVARALINKPEVLLLDEPTSALDPEAATRLIRSIRGLNENPGLTVIMVTHQMEYAKLFGGRVIYIEGGAVKTEQRAEDFFQNA